jgi:hypothetical protein
MIDFELAPIRPRAVSIVAVIWLYLGVSWLGIALVMLPAFTLFASWAWGTAWPFCAFLLTIAVVSGVAVRSALQVLQLRSCGRQRLEWTSWATFVLFMLFTLQFCSVIGEVPTYYGYGTYFDATRAVWPFLGGTLTSLPFVFLARALRSDEVRFAVRDAEARRLTSGPASDQAGAPAPENAP